MDLNNDANNHFFNVFIIKPNAYIEGKSYSFDEDVYKILKHKISDGPYTDYNDAVLQLTNYLKKKDFFQRKETNFQDLLPTFEKYINPNNVEGRSYDVKTCLDSDNELIMYTFDASIRDPNQFNHLSTILNSNFETTFGPVFITKILKQNNKVIKHINIELEDIAKLWLANKQIFCWSFCGSSLLWTKQLMFNNNKYIDNKYKYINVKLSIVFYILKDGINIDNDEITKILEENINNNEILSQYFSGLKICKLKTGEYINMNLNYNTEHTSIHEHISNTALSGVSNFDKYKVVMESIFKDVYDKIDL